MRVINTKALKRANLRSIEAERNATLTVSTVRNLDPDGFHLITFHTLHNDEAEVRCTMLLKETGRNEPVRATFDMSMGDFMNETVDIQSLEDIEDIGNQT